MSVRDKFYHWWKGQPKTVRKPFVFVLGLVFILCAPLVGWIPGPGGVVIFLAGIAILASEFDWAESLKAFFVETVPKEVKRRWRPTPKWETAFDATSLVLLIGAGTSVYFKWWAPVLSLGIGGVCIFVFNRERLTRLKKHLNKN